MDLTADFYSRPSHEFRGSGGFHVFAGSRRQRGGSIFGSLKNIILPVLKPLLKELSSKLLSSGLGLASDVATNVLAGKNIKDVIKNQGTSRAKAFGKEALKTGVSALTKMVGKGSRRRRRVRRLYRRKLSKKRKRKRRPVSRKPVSRKRRSRSKSSHTRKSKRRRIAVNF